MCHSVAHPFLDHFNAGTCIAPTGTHSCATYRIVDNSSRYSIMHVSINPSLILSCQPCPFGCSNVCGCRHPINVTEMIPDTQVPASTPSLLPNLPTPSLTFLLPDSTSNVSFTSRCKGAILSTPSLQTFSQQPPILMLPGRLCVWVFCCALHGEQRAPCSGSVFASLCSLSALGSNETAFSWLLGPYLLPPVFPLSRLLWAVWEFSSLLT